MFHSGIPYIEVLATKFSKFDQGKAVTFSIWTERCTSAHLIQNGDTVPWGCAQYTGTAEVVKIEKVKENKYSLTLKKID